MLFPAPPSGDVEPKAPAAPAVRRRPTAVVDPDRCIGCAVCLDACLDGAISVGEVAVIDPERCTGCGACVDECPDGAISLGEARGAGVV